MRRMYRDGHRGGRVIRKTPELPVKPANKSISGNDDYRFSAESHPVPAEPQSRSRPTTARTSYTNFWALFPTGI